MAITSPNLNLLVSIIGTDPRTRVGHYASHGAMLRQLVLTISDVRWVDCLQLGLLLVVS